ncbi:UNVERIFIED_CONTAM: hypothetical protein BEN50_11290 [Euhalothece sp. KZN 001]
MGVSWLRSSLVVLSTLSIIMPSASAGERLDGTVYFEAAPCLKNVKTTFNETHRRGATYYFTLTLPSNAGEPLGELVITQRLGIDDIPLLLEKTTAFVGTPNDKQESLSLANVSQSEDHRKITATFRQPIPPGTTMTLGLKPRKNPQYDGVYLFGITARPAGNITQDLYLGVRRLQFYDRSNDNDFRVAP